MQPSLIVLGNTLTALSVVRDASRRGLAPVLVDKAWGIACHTRRARLEMLDADAGEARHLARLVELGRAGSNLLIATGDSWLRFIVRNRAALDGAYARVLHADNAVLETCLNKTRFARWCREHDVPAPLAWFPGQEERPAQLRLPLFLRPADTLHDRPVKGIPKAAQAHSEAELEAWLKRYAEARVEPLVTESLLGQPLIQYSVAVARAGTRTMSFVAEKVRPGPEACSVGTYVRLSPAPAIEASVLTSMEKLRYFGIAEVEVLYAPETRRHVLIEINARPWLQYALAPASGHDFLGVLIGLQGHERQCKSGLAWLNFHDDLFACWSRSIGMVRHGHVSLMRYLASVTSSSVHPIFSADDLMPYVHSLRWLPLPNKRRRSRYAKNA